MDPFGINNVQKLLLDAKADARQKGLHAVGAKVVALFREKPLEEAARILVSEEERIEEEYIKVTTTSFRRAGLMLIRTIVSSIPRCDYPHSVLDAFTMVTLNSTTDADPVVRVAAMEACHEVVRKFRLQLLERHLLNLFNALSVAIGDRDYRVALLAQEVSAAVREMVSSHPQEYTMDAALFVRFFCTTLEPFRLSRVSDQRPVVLWALEWAQFLFDIPGLQVGEFIPLILRTVLELPVGSPDDAKYKLLQQCQYATQKSLAQQHDQYVSKTLEILMDVIKTTEVQRVKVFCLQWMADLSLLCEQCEWLHAQLGHAVACILPQLSSAVWDADVREQTLRVDAQLVQIVRRIPQTSKVLGDILTAAIACIVAPGVQEARVAAMRWLTVVYQADRPVVASRFRHVFESLMVLLKDSSTDVVVKALGVLCLVVEEEKFDFFIASLLEATADDPVTMLPRLPGIIKQLQTHHESDNGEGCEKVLVSLATALGAMSDLRFVCKMVITLNTMVLTCAEFAQVRALLKKSLEDPQADKFVSQLVCSCWKYNGVALVSLCLMCRLHAVSFGVCQRIGEAEVSASTLLQLDRLAQLLESPVFSFVRLAILEPSHSVLLIKTLFAILALLPQSSPQYACLYGRLKIVQGLSHLESLPSGQAGATRRDPSPTPGAGSVQREDEFIRQFAEAQAKLADYERKIMRAS